jgi:hypothetical protein
MSEPAESVSMNGRSSESSIRTAPTSSEPARSSSVDLQPPPSSGPSSSSYLPPPPAQLVAALAEFETSGPGPESFRRSVPDFTPPDAPIGAPDASAKASPARVEAPQPPARSAAAPAISSKIAGIVGGVAFIIVALWALLSR